MDGRGYPSHRYPPLKTHAKSYDGLHTSTAMKLTTITKTFRNFLVANLCALLPLWVVAFGWMPDQVKVEVRGAEPVALVADGLVLQGEEHGVWKEGTVWRFYLREGMVWKDLAFRLPEGMDAEDVGRVRLEKWKLLSLGKAGNGLERKDGGANEYIFREPRFERVGLLQGKIPLGLAGAVVFLLGLSWWFAKRHRGEHWKTLLPSVLGVAFALALLMQVALPLQSYLANRSAFPFTPGELGCAIAFRFVVALAVGGLALGLLTRCFGRWVLAPVLAFTACAYLEAGALSIGLPSLNGDWSFFNNPTRALWDGAVWLFVFGIVCGLHGVFLKKHYATASLCLTGLIAVSILDVKHSKKADTSHFIVQNFSACEDVIHNISYSTNRNVMVFIIDSLEREQAHTIMETPEVGGNLREQFRGFSEYVDNVGALPFSMAAVANLLTGLYPEKTTSMVDYFWSCYSSESALADFLETNHAVYMTTPALECAFSSESIKSNAQGMRHISPLHVKGGGAWSLLDLNRWRWMPFATKATYAYLMEVQGVADGDFREWKVFPILKEGNVVSAKNGVFLFIHTPGVHVPAVCDRNGTFVTPEDDESGSFEQGIYLLKLLGALMDSYREKGIYDNSLIVVLGDHGRHQWGGYTLETNMLPFNGRPCLWMKPMGCRADFASSSIPSSHAKVAEVLKRSAHHDLTETEIQDILTTDQRIYHRIEWWGGVWNEWIVGKDGTTVFRAGTECDFGSGAKPLKCGSRYSFKIVDFAQNGADIYFSNVVNQGGLPVFRPDAGEMSISFRVPDVTRTYRANLWTGDVGSGMLEVSQCTGSEWSELPVTPQTNLAIHHIAADTNGMATLRFRWKENSAATAAKFESFVLEMEP